MKTTLLCLLFICISFCAFSQVPQGFNYQAIARDVSGNTIVNYSLPVRITIQSDSLGGTTFWIEEHTTVTTNSIGLFTLIVGKGVRKTGSTVLTFDKIDWTVAPKYIKTEINYSGWKVMGSSRFWAVPYSMVSAKADSAKALSAGSKLAVVSSNDLATDALFEVKRKDGQTVFAVYPDAVNIYVPNGAKGSTKGGFAIGGFDEAKGNSQDFFRVTPDSVRVYIDNTPPVGKGSTKGGFAIGGFDAAKGILPNYFMNVTGAADVNTVMGSPQVLWYPNKNAFLAGNVHIGSIDSVGSYSTALGYRSIAMGDYSQAFGYRAKTFGDYSTSIGKLSIAGARVGGVSTASNAFAFGNGALATGGDSYAFGSGASASGYRSFAFGSVGLDDSGNPTSTPTTANQSYSFAIGMGAQATQKGAMALGIGSLASGYYSNSFGYYSTSSAYYSTALGFRSTASNNYSGAFGYYAKADGLGSLALGNRSWAVNNYSTAVGDSAKTQADYASAFGRMAKAKGMNSVAVGYNAQTLASDAGAFGKNSVANGTGSVAIGNASTTGSSATDAGAFGKSASATGVSSLALGTSASASGNTSVALGYNAQAAGDFSFAIGTFGLDGAGAPNTVPTKTTTSAPYSIAIGMGTQAQAQGTVAIGVNSTATASSSTAIGYGASTGSSAFFATAIGNGSSATGQYSTALGFDATANGTKSISFGAHYNADYYMRIFIKFPFPGHWSTIHYAIDQANIADGDYSIAIGNGNWSKNGGTTLGTYNKADSIGATAIGHSNHAYRPYSFATGFSSSANGTHSFAAGYSNNASGENSYAFGESLIAQSMNSFVVGTNNTDAGSKSTWVTTDPLFIVGNGGLGSASNALVVSKNGNTTINGNLTVTGTITSYVGTGDGLGNHTASQNIKLNGYWLSNDGGNEGVFVSTSGLVGINDNTPSYNLDISGNMRVTGSIYGNSNLYMTGGIYGTTINSDNNANLTIDAGTLHVDGTNNRIGINNLTPAYGLDVTGTMNVTSNGRFGGDVTLASSSPAFYFTDTDLNDDDFKFEANIDLLSVTTLGKTPLTVLAMASTGSVSMPNLRGGTGTTLVINSSTGEIMKNTSSIEYKTDVKTLNDISWLFNLKPVDYLYKSDNLKQRQYGLIAEDVVNVNKDLVFFNNGKPDAVNYNGLIAPLLKAVQDQNKTIESLKQENETLKERLEKLEELVLTIKAVNK